MIEKKRIEIFPKHMGFFRTCGLCIYYFNLPFSTSIRMEDCARKRYVDTFYYHIPSAIFCSEDVYFMGMHSNDTHLLFALFYNPFMIFLAFSRQVRWDLHQVRKYFGYYSVC